MPYIPQHLQVVINLLAENAPSALTSGENCPVEPIMSEKVDEVAEVVEVGSPVQILQNVIDVMAYEEVQNPEEIQVARSACPLIPEQLIEAPPVNPVHSRPAGLREVKTYVDAETQTEPWVCSPVAGILTPRRKRKLVEKDHAYCKKKLELEPMQPEPSYIPKTSTKDDASQESDSSDDEWDADIDGTGTDYDSDTSDEDWVPDEDEMESDNENPDHYEKTEINWLSETQELYKESKSIVFDSNLKQLFKRCQRCGEHVKFASLKQRGSLICVTSTCAGGHTENWFSQPFTKGVATGNLTFSGGILYTGNHFASTSTFMSSCNIRFVQKGIFYSMQRKYLWPVVNHRYLLQHRELLQSLRGERLVLAGDGRCDSPGHNAKYGTYSIMHVPTEKILDFSLVQVSEVANSNCMEKEGLKRCLQNLETDGQIIDTLATDRYR